MSKFKIYTVNDDYIDHLRKKEPRVTSNKKNNPTYTEEKPYIGILFEINNLKYIAPFTSDKKRKLLAKSDSDITCHRILDKKKYDKACITNPNNTSIEKYYYGAININNMIPVYDNNITPLDMKTQCDPNYAYLLNRQLRILNEPSEKQNLITKATDLHKILTTDNKAKQHFAKHCLDLTLLETEALRYNSSQSNSFQSNFFQSK